MSDYQPGGIVAACSIFEHERDHTGFYYEGAVSFSYQHLQIIQAEMKLFTLHACTKHR